MNRQRHVCCGKPTKRFYGLKLYTDPICQQGRRVRHASACGCTYKLMYSCVVCPKMVQDGEVAPYLLADIFSL